MSDWFANTASSGSLLLAVPVALVAGLVSFFSPCVMPLLPGYLSYVTGLSAADLEDAKRGRMFAGALLFVLGFSAVYISLGSLFGSIGLELRDHQHAISVTMGIVIVVLGLAFMGLVPWMQRDVRVHKIPAIGLWAAPLIGALFGVGWTPCIGPTLSAVLGLSLNESTATRGAFLTLFYCLGLGIPFILAALGFRRFMGAVGWIRRHQRSVSYVGGGLLVAVGLLLVTGAWDSIVEDLRGWTSGYGTAV